jgi:cell division protein FtsI/penicillin-binding protein 2
MITGNVKAGADVILTLNYNIQFMAEKLLKEAKENLDFESGQIIVGDPYTGKIIAMAEFPNFNPNEYTKEINNIEIFQNSCIQKLFEPGSVFKPITMAAGLDTQTITPQTKYYDDGFLKIGGYTIRNFGQRAWGERTMNEVLEKSINTGAVFVERQIGPQTFLKYIENFDFFEPTGIDLQGEVSSNNSNLKEGYEVNFATASFGQGIEITPIQLFKGISVIANGGKLIKPYVVEKIIKDGKEIKTLPSISNESVISPQTANQLTAMMVNVVEHGYGKEGRIPGYYIAGKTGTAEVPEGGDYSLNRTIQTFVAFAPAFNPKFLILVKLDNPKASTAEYSAAPIFKEMAKYIIDLWQIPPDYETK